MADKEPERKDDQAGDVDKLIGDLEAHSLHDEVPDGDELVPDTDTCTCGTCGCGGVEE